MSTIKPTTDFTATTPVASPAARSSNPLASLTQAKDTFTSSGGPVEVSTQVSHATQLAEDGTLLSPEQLHQAMKKEKNFSYGSAPAELKKALNGPDKDIHASLDNLAGQLYKSRLSRGESKQIALKKGGEATVEYLGEGMKAVVYKLNVGGQAYALKVFRPGTAGSDIAFQEVANGAFMNANDVKDASRLYMANPAKNWTLMEHMGPDASLAHRFGNTMQELGISTSDEGEKNRINGILIDHGGTFEVPADYRADETLFQEAIREVKPQNLLKRLFR